MGEIGKPEWVTQRRVIQLFKDELGYRFLGDWTDRDSNSNIEEKLLTDYLRHKGGYSPAQISAALHKLRIEADNPNRRLYDNNQAVYNLLRYGVPVKTEAGKPTETVHLINWSDPEANDFAIAEEVTLKGNHERRPDLVLYVNGIALGVMELKNSRVSIGDGIRQNLSNQQPEFNEWFFSTIQFVFAGNDSEGLQYGTIDTPEKYFLRWKEDEEDNSRFKVDKYLMKMCNKQRLIELLHDFVLFDGGVKKLPRVHQYFGIKAAQEHVREKRGGIIWHTQGSGKSIVMVLLAKWILENNPNARVAIVTDRDELDKQIERVFTEAGESIKRTSSGRDLMTQLSQATPRLLCSLVHKFGRKDVNDFDKFIKELEAQPSPTVGEVFVFVDECHRTQSGKLHRVMKAMMPNAVFVGFTGTPLLKKDKATSLEVFGGYIHTYKFSEAVEDEVVLDLIYEARDIDQNLGSQGKIDAWFDAKTKGLNDWQKAELKLKWGTMQNVLSSRSRMDRVVADIVFDFSVKPRLSNERGNAILVASSIYEACKYYTLFQKTPFKGKCAVVTSYNPQTKEGATGVPLCCGGVESVLFSGDSEGLVVVPVVAQAGGSVGEHGQGAVEAPAHAGAVQSVLDDETARAFDDAAGDRVALTQVLAVTHARAVVLEVRDRRLNRGQRFFTQAAFLQHLPQAADHATQVASQHARQTFVDERLGGCVRIALQFRDLTQSFEEVPEVQNLHHVLAE
jgi:type I restriction enzyme, R subunit